MPIDYKQRKEQRLVKHIADAVENFNHDEAIGNAPDNNGDLRGIVGQHTGEIKHLVTFKQLIMAATSFLGILGVIHHYLHK